MGRVTSATFVGRAAELADLDHALERSIEGRTTTVLIAGDAGIGKSRLIASWNERARERGAAVVVGWCLNAGESGPAYAAVVQAIRQLLDSGDATADAIRRTDRSALAQVLPELSTSRSVDDPGITSPTGHTALLDRLASVLVSAAADRTLVLELEDLHWADPSTRAFLSYLVLSYTQARLLIIGTYRREELVRDHPLAATIRQLERREGVSLVDLRPFTRDELRSQLTWISGAAPPPSLLDAIFDRSEGNALFAEEILASGGASGDLPRSVGDALLARSAGLTDAAGALLRLASVGGRTIRYPVLLRAGGLDETQLTDALRECVEANILEPEHEGERFRFRHTLLQEAIYRDSLPGERRRLHASIAQALEATSANALIDPDVVPELARQWSAAGDANRALAASAAAADVAVRQSAPVEAMHHYQRVLNLWPEAEQARTQLSKPVILERAARSAYRAGQPQLAIDFGEAALAEIGESSDRPLLVEVLDVIRIAWDHVGTGEAVLPFARRVAAIDPTSLPAAQQGMILDGRIMLHQRQGDYVAAGVAAAELRELADRSGDATLQARARLSAGWLLVDRGSYAEAAAAATEALELASSAGDADAQVQALDLAYEVAWTQRHLEETIAAARDFRETAARLGLLRMEGPWSALAEAESLYALGRLEESRAVIDEQLQDPPADRSLPLLVLQLAQVAIARGELAQAQDLIEQASRIKSEDDDEVVLGMIPLARMRLANAQGRLDDVRAIAELSGPQLSSAPAHAELTELTWAMALEGLAAAAARMELAQARADANAVEAARTSAMAILDVLEGVRRRRKEAGLDRMRRHDDDDAVIAAQVARLEGQNAASLWAAAAEAFPVGSVEALSARHRQAEALLAAAAPRDEISAVVQPALARAVEIGARPIASQLESVARRARIALRSPDAPQVDRPATLEAEPVDPGRDALHQRGLSDREIEVLTLVAAGYSNREIAERLFIASKTASVHVTHILDKLGASSRTEAATIAVRLGLPDVEETGPGRTV